MEAITPAPIEPEQITRANPDLGDRLFKEGVHLAYDEDSDTLFITIGEPKVGVAKPSIDGIYIQVEPTNYRIIGCTILAFSVDFLGKNKLIRKMFPGLIETFKASGNVLELKGQQAEKIRPLFEEALSR